eukprot:s303_g34.t5
MPLWPENFVAQGTNVFKGTKETMTELQWAYFHGLRWAPCYLAAQHVHPTRQVEVWRNVDVPNFVNHVHRKAAAERMAFWQFFQEFGVIGLLDVNWETRWKMISKMPWQRWQGAAVLPLSWRRGNFEPRVSGPATWPSICSFDFGGMTASQSVRCLALAAPMVPLLLIACGCVEVFSLGVGITVGLKMLTLLFIGGAEVHSFRAASEQMQAWSLPSARFFHPNGAKKPCGFGDVDRIGCATARTIFQGFHVIEAPASVVACVRYGICLARSGPFLGDQELHPGKSSFFQDGFVASSPPSPIPGSTSPATRSGSAGALAGEQRAEDDGVATGLLVRRGHLSSGSAWAPVYTTSASAPSAAVSLQAFSGSSMEAPTGSTRRIQRTRPSCWPMTDGSLAHWMDGRI